MRFRDLRDLRVFVVYLHPIGGRPTYAPFTRRIYVRGLHVRSPGPSGSGGNPMSTIIKLVIAGFILNAAAHAGMAAFNYYQLKDASQELVTFGANASEGEIQNQIFAKAETLNVPLQTDDITVRRDGLHTLVSASYTQPVEVFPHYTYPVNFRFSVDAVTMAGLGPSSLKP